MRYKTDMRYVMARTLEALAAVAVAVFMVLEFFHLSDPEGFVYSAITASIVIYILFFLPRPIAISDGCLCFVKKNSLERIRIPLRDIADVKVESGWWKKLHIITDNGNKYVLHPSDAEGLKKELLNK